VSSNIGGKKEKNDLYITTDINAPLSIRLRHAYDRVLPSRIMSKV
jgi:hypothetical protein